ncbi:MAG: hypothetical protein MMC33_008938 [Icmadophila ericetorum]|nr:hypothetical protein [Icmadophila ericetorum]
MVARSGTRIALPGLCDVVDNHVLDQSDAWQDESLWTALAASGLGEDHEKIKPAIEMEISTNKRALALKQVLGQAVVLDSKILTSAGCRATKATSRFAAPSSQNIRHLAGLASETNQSAALISLASMDPITEDVRQQPSILDLLKRFPSIALSFSEYLSLRTRLYSISSSPPRDPAVCFITFGVPNASGDSTSRPTHYVGVASPYLSGLSRDDRVHIAVRPNLAATTPIVIICAGTGLAPFRGFVLERLLHICVCDGLKLAPTLLFVGCRSSTGDKLYTDEHDMWEKEGAVELRYAFSREKKISGGCSMFRTG